MDAKTQPPQKVLGSFLGIAWGASRLVLLGVAAILCVFVIFGAVFYVGLHRGGIFDRVFSRVAVGMLNDCVKEIELYKTQHGHYPASLSELDLKDKKQLQKAKTFDPMMVEWTSGRDPHFFYQVDPSGSFYLLRSVGPDGVPFTADDIVPTIPENERAKTGLRLQR